jgi:hypothetical protein
MTRNTTTADGKMSGIRNAPATSSPAYRAEMEMGEAKRRHRDDEPTVIKGRLATRSVFSGSTRSWPAGSSSCSATGRHGLEASPSSRRPRTSPRGCAIQAARRCCA